MAVRIIGIYHVQIAAPPGCEPAARAFYGRVLGLPQIEKPVPLRERGGCWFQVGDRQLHVGVDPDFVPARKAHPAFAVPDAAAAYDALVAASVACEWDRTIAGVRRFYAADPWGNRLECTEITPGPRETRAR